MRSGDVISDRYRLESPVATGGMGDVWRATDTVLARVVAVKVLRPGLLTDLGFGARFRAEARMLAALHHPGVVDVYDYGEAGGNGASDTAYLVMAYVDGEPLSARIARAGRLDPTETMSIVAQAARSLHAAHAAGIVHRDVKPGNLLIRPDGTVVLVDFGIARSAASSSITATGEVIGTALYMAPEQVSKQPVTAATDVYALGAVAYHCLAGRPPFSGPHPVEVALSHLDDDPPPLPPDVPADIRALVATAMAKDVLDRYPNAAAMADAAETAAGRPDPATTAELAATAAVGLGPAGVVLGPAAVGLGPAATAMLPAVDAAPPESDPSSRRGPGRQRAVAAIAVMLLAVATVVTLVALALREDPPPGQAPNLPATSGSAGVGGPGPGSPARTPGATRRPTATPGSPGGSPATTGQPTPPPPPPTGGPPATPPPPPAATSAPAATEPPS